MNGNEFIDRSSPQAGQVVRTVRYQCEGDAGPVTDPSGDHGEHAEQPVMLDGETADVSDHTFGSVRRELEHPVAQLRNGHQSQRAPDDYHGGPGAKLRFEVDP